MPVLRGFALSGRMLARFRRANNVLCCVEHALRACSTQHNTSGERRRREQAIVMEIRHTLNKKVLIAAWWFTLLLQIRGNDEPHAFKTLAVSLAGSRIPGVGIQGMAVVFDLVAVGRRKGAQLAGK